MPDVASTATPRSASTSPTGRIERDLHPLLPRAQNLNAFTTYLARDPYPIVSTTVPRDGGRRAQPLDGPGRVSNERWLFLGLADWAASFPVTLSIVDEALDFVGPRNTHRFPTVVSTDSERGAVNILRWRPWIGVRVENPFRAFLPTDVQANLASAAFGTFYNSEYRQFRVIIRFER